MLGKCVYLGVSHVSHPKRAEFQRSPILMFLSIYGYMHPLSQNYQILHGNTCREVYVSLGQLGLLTQESGVPAFPIFGVFSYLCLHPLTQNDQIRHVNTYGEGVF